MAACAIAEHRKIAPALDAVRVLEVLALEVLGKCRTGQAGEQNGGGDGKTHHFLAKPADRGFSDNAPEWRRPPNTRARLPYRSGCSRDFAETPTRRPAQTHCARPSSDNND